MMISQKRNRKNIIQSTPSRRISLVIETMGNDKDSRPTIKVVVRPKAFCSMVLHAAKHKNEVVHGILWGSSSPSTDGRSKTAAPGVVTLTVHDAVPVSHGTPTRPLIETAIGLIESSQTDDDNNSNNCIVGWYTAPTLLKDTRPGPIALRMAANFEMKKDVNTGETQHQPSTLLVLQNSAIGPCLQGKSTTTAKDVVKALGKDFADQYLNPVDNMVIDDGEKACRAVEKAYKAKILCNDLVDHLSGPPSTPWYPNTDLNAFLVQNEC